MQQVTCNQTMQLEPVINQMFVEVPEDDRHIDLNEVMEITGVKRTTIFDLQNKFLFPRSHMYTPKSRRWWLSEVKHWRQLGCDSWYERYGKIHEKADRKAKLNA